MTSTRILVRRAVLDALAVVAPTACSGCGAPDRALCDDCAAALRPSARLLNVDGLPVAFAHDYDGVVRHVLASYKDAGRTDAASRLAPSLRASITLALRSTPSPHAAVRLVAIPSSRAAHRERGYSPVALLLDHAGLRAGRALRIVRDGSDQAGLTADARRVNRDGWLAARPWARGTTVLLVDDILTTGSTLREARRALAGAGATVVGAAVVARTPLRHDAHPRHVDGRRVDETTRGRGGTPQPTMK